MFLFNGAVAISLFNQAVAISLLNQAPQRATYQTDGGLCVSIFL